MKHIHFSSFHHFFLFIVNFNMSSEDIEAYAKLQGETKEWYVKDLPFYFGRETGKSPEAFLNICMDKKDKTVSREFAILQYNKDKVVLY